ncbi:MAG TPA: hypothetical protein VMX95_05355 [Thermodesulfobacteriota bacterium]|nr:hypothetical protein [Thermodesulfobacteriota bacterium]
MLEKTNICILTTLLFLTQIALPDSIDISSDSLSDICEALESAVLDVTVSYQTHNDPPPALKDISGTGNLLAKGPIKYVWSAARPFAELSKSTETVAFMNEHGDSWDSVTSQSYNGEIAKHHVFIGGPDTRSRVTISRTRNFMPNLSVTPLGFTLLIFKDKLLSRLLRESDKSLIHLDTTVETTGNFRTVHLDLLVRVNDKEFLSKRIYFSVDHGFTPVKFEYFNGRNLSATVQVLELQKVAEGLWFPKKGRISNVSSPRAWVYEANDITINQGLKKSYFDIDFPPGTEVQDEITGLRYIVGPTEDQIDKWLDEEIAISSKINKGSGSPISRTNLNSNLQTAPKLEKPPVPPGQVSRADLPSNWKQSLFWLLLAISAIAILAVFLLRAIVRRKGH